MRIRWTVEKHDVPKTLKKRIFSSFRADPSRTAQVLESAEGSMSIEAALAQVLESAEGSMSIEAALTRVICRVR